MKVVKDNYRKLILLNYLLMYKRIAIERYGGSEMEDGVVSIKGSETFDFASFYQENYPKVCSYLENKIQNKNDIEDIVEESFLYFYQNRYKYDASKASPTTWLYIIVKSEWKNYLRDRNLYENIDDVNIPGKSELDQAIYLEEAQNIIRQALLALPIQQRDIVKMSYFGEMSSQEIGEKLSISPINVRVQLSRALKKMSKYLEPYKFEE